MKILVVIDLQSTKHLARSTPTLDMSKTRGLSLPAMLTSCNSSRWASQRTRKKLPRFLICVILLTAVRARASFFQRSIIRHRQFQPQYPIWESSTSIFLLSWLKGSSCRPSSLRITTQFLYIEISLRKSWWPTRIRKWCSGARKGVYQKELPI